MNAKIAAALFSKNSTPETRVTRWKAREMYLECEATLSAAKLMGRPEAEIKRATADMLQAKTDVVEHLACDLSNLAAWIRYLERDGKVLYNTREARQFYAMTRDLVMAKVESFHAQKSLDVKMSTFCEVFEMFLPQSEVWFHISDIGIPEAFAFRVDMSEDIPF